MDDRYLNQFFAYWVISVIAVGFVTWCLQQFGYEFYRSQSYDWLSALSPGMQLLPVRAKNESVAAALWVYITYSFPVWFCLAVRSIDHCRLPPEVWKRFLALTMLWVLAITAMAILFFAKIFDVNNSSVYSRMYKHSAIGTVLIPVVVGGAALVMNIMVTLYIRELWRRVGRAI